MADTLTAGELSQFTGTDNWYKHPLAPGITYTDGVKYMAEKAGAYWLLDQIAIPQRYESKLKAHPFQVWKLRRDTDGPGAELIVEDGNDNVIQRQRIDCTDFPLLEIDLWFTDNVILLPSEY